MNSKKENLGWGKTTEAGAEIWDANPIFLQMPARRRDWLKLVFYPKKFFLYQYIKKALQEEIKHRDLSDPFTILDVGCGTGSTVIDFKRAFGRRVDVTGIDVVRLQIDIGRKKIKERAINAELDWYDGKQFPFSDKTFDAVYTSDVLGHVAGVELWLSEINRVLKSGGALAMFAESKLGRHALVRNYLFKRGLNVDPHKKYHISLYSKNGLKRLVEGAGFEIESMRSVFWASFFAHPDEFYHELNASGQRGFFVLRMINKLLTFVKKKAHPVSTAASELYGLVEACLIGKWIEAQGYIILGKKS
ncbi:MAG: class I SAM-dependent methyltransferase [Patescibacteria group bacterium]